MRRSSTIARRSGRIGDVAPGQDGLVRQGDAADDRRRCRPYGRGAGARPENAGIGRRWRGHQQQAIIAMDQHAARQAGSRRRGDAQSVRPGLRAGQGNGAFRHGLARRPQQGARQHGVGKRIGQGRSPGRPQQSFDVRQGQSGSPLIHRRQGVGIPQRVDLLPNSCEAAVGFRPRRRLRSRGRALNGTQAGQRARIRRYRVLLDGLRHVLPLVVSIRLSAGRVLRATVSAQDAGRVPRAMKSRVDERQVSPGVRAQRLVCLPGYLPALEARPIHSRARPVRTPCPGLSPIRPARRGWRRAVVRALSHRQRHSSQHRQTPGQPPRQSDLFRIRRARPTQMGEPAVYQHHAGIDRSGRCAPAPVPPRPAASRCPPRRSTRPAAAGRCRTAPRRSGNLLKCPDPGGSRCRAGKESKIASPLMAVFGPPDVRTRAHM